MSTTITLKNLGAFAGATNLQLFLRRTSDNTLLAAGGDTGVDADSIGSFAWTIAEAMPNEQLLARIYEGATETKENIVIDSVLNVGFTEIAQEAAVLDAATLIRFVTEDTGETEAADGSVAKLAQGAGGAGGTDWTSEQRTYILAQLALLSLSGSAVVVTSGTFMCARGDVEQVYGNRNVEKWADLNNTADADEILSRINYHIAMADNYIRAAISNGAWVMPESGDTIPAILAYNCARLAGVLMYEARGVSDYDSNGRPIHQLMYHKKSVDDFLKSVLNGSISLAPLTYGITNAAPEAT